MARNKVYFGAVIFVLVAIITWTSYSTLHVGRKEETYRVSVIVNDSNNDRWTALRQGLEQAAKDNNIDLNYVSTGKLNSAREETLLIIREEDNGAQGIMVQMVSDVEGMAGISARVPVILLESEVNPEGVYTFVGPDNRELGKAAARAVKNDLGESLEGKTIGILCGSRKQPAMMQRLQGLLEELGEDIIVSPNGEPMAFPDDGSADSSGSESAGFSGSESMGSPGGESAGFSGSGPMDFSGSGPMDSCEPKDSYESMKIVWIVENEGMLDLEAAKQQPPDIVIALGNDETEQVVDYLLAREEGSSSCLLYGVGCSEKAVYYLDRGIIQTLVVPNEFNMGYQSMEAMANMLRYHLTEVQDSQVGYLVIDRNNMYDADNQKILFPIVQ